MYLSWLGLGSIKFAKSALAITAACLLGLSFASEAKAEKWAASMPGSAIVLCDDPISCASASYFAWYPDGRTDFAGCGMGQDGGTAYCSYYQSDSRNWTWEGSALRVCAPSEQADGTGRCAVPDRQKHCPVGNPVFARSGVKYESVVDARLGAARPLTFSRDYWSTSERLAAGWKQTPRTYESRIGRHWQTNLDSRLIYYTGIATGPGAISDPNKIYKVLWIASDGAELLFQSQNGPNSPGAPTVRLSYNHGSKTFEPATDRTETLTLVGSTWVVTTGEGTKYAYNYEGDLVTITERDGYTQTLVWTNGVNTSVSDSLGRQISFAYGPNGHLSSATLPDGKIITYTYYDKIKVPALAGTNGPHPEYALKRVTWQEGPTPSASDKYIEYAYDNVSFPFALTSKTDGTAAQISSWTYNADGRVATAQRAGGVDTYTFAYNPAGGTSTVTNALGKQTVINYNANRAGDALITSVQGLASPNCPASNTTSTFDTSGYLATRADEEARVTGYVNDARGNPTSITRGQGTPSASTTTISWHPTWDLPTQVVEPGLTTTYSWNALGQLAQISELSTTTQTVPYATTGQTRTTAFTYTAGGLLATVDGPLSGTGDTTTYTYNAQGHLQTITNQVGHVTTVNSWNGRGQPTRVTDPNGLMMDFAYNAKGSVTAVTLNPLAGARVTTLVRDGADRITAITTPDGVTLTLAYDPAGRMTRIQNAANESVEYSYNALGNVTATTAKAGTSVVAQRNATFDEMGRMLKSIGADGVAGGRVWSFAYDKTSNLTSVTDPRSQVFSAGFDSLNRLVSTTDPGPAAVTLTRNGKDEITSYKDPRNITTTYVRNGFGEVIRRSSPGTGNTTYWYDARGLLNKVVDARGFETLFTYDNAGRRLTKAQTGATTENVTYTYDAVVAGSFNKGRLTKIVDPAGSSDFKYDLYGNVTEEKRTIGTRGYTVGYSYNAANKLASITYPSGRIVTYLRDTTGRISSVTTKETSAAATANLATSIQWQPFGGSGIGGGILGSASPMAAPLLPVTEPAGAGGGAESGPAPVTFGPSDALIDGRGLIKSLNHGNGLALWRSYNADHLLNEIGLYDNSTSPQTVRLRRFHGYTDNLSLTQIWDNLNASESQNFWLDPAGRLQNADGPWGQDVTYHDGVGNRTSFARTLSGATTTRFYGYGASSNLLFNVTIGATTERLMNYDASGNLITDNRGTAGNFAYVLNRSNRIASVTKGGVAQATYLYDAFERLRVRTLTNQTATSNNGATHYVWDIFGQIIAEANGATGATLRETVYLEGMPLAAIDAAASPKKTYAVHVDHLNRPIMLTDAAKTNVWWARYEPFGRVHATGGTLTQNLGLPGQWFQLETGLAYNWHRHYDPTTGRYTTPDPLGFVDGPSVFAYAGNNPQRVVDPSGLNPPIPNFPNPKIPGGPWAWVPDPTNSRGGKFYGPGGVSASWDTKYRHWDCDDGKGNRQRYNWRGAPIPADESHRPRNYTPKWPPNPRSIPPIIVPIPVICAIVPGLCDRTEAFHE